MSEPSRKPTETVPKAAIVFLVLVHLALALPLAYQLNIWSDEASTLFTTEGGILRAFEIAASIERQAPLYFWAMSAWRMIDESVFFARLFSIICSAASIVVFASLAARLFPRRAAVAATALFALHPYLIWASVEIRVYSLVGLLTLALLSLFLRAFWQKETLNLYSAGGFVVAAVAALYVNYYLGFALVGLFVSLIVTRQFAMARAYLLSMVVTALAAIPLFVIASSQFVVNAGDYREQTPVIEGVRLIWHHVVTFLMPTEVFNDGIATLIDVARAWIVRIALTALLILAVLRRNRVSARTVLLVALTAAISAFMLAAYMMLGSHYIELRHAAVLFAPTLLTLISLSADLAPRKDGAAAGLLAAAGTAIVVASFSLGFFSLYPRMAKPGDWIRLAEFVQAHETAGQPIVVFTAYDSLSLPYHYTGVNRVLPASQHFDFPTRQAEFGSPLSRRAEIDFVISEIPPDARQIWLATGDICQSTETCAALENYITANYTVEIEQDFYREKLRLLKRK
jgi:hypothetical protein